MEQQQQQQPARPGGWRQSGEEDGSLAQQSEQYGTFDEEISMEQQQQQPAGGRSRGYFSLTDDHDDGVEDEYRAWLKVTFREAFESYESEGGMPLYEFKSLVGDTDVRRRYKLAALFDRLDRDRNERVSWNEFYDGLVYPKKAEVGTGQQVINKVVKKLAPAAKRKVRETKKAAADQGEPIPKKSYLQAYNCRPPPLFIPIFFVACWIVFIVYAVELNRGPDWNHVTWSYGLPYYSPLCYCPSLRQQAWRFLSYALLHNGYHHIVFNTVLGCLLGIPLETVHKAWRVVPVFTVGCVFGALFSSVLDSGTALVGASGGVYSLIGAHYALVLMNWEEVQKDWLRCRKGNPLKFLLSGVMRLVYLTALVALDFGISAYRRYYSPVKVPMSFEAHVGGLVAGLLFATPVLRNLDKKPWEGVVAIVALVAFCVLTVFGVFWNIFYKGFPAADVLACSNPSLVEE